MEIIEGWVVKGLPFVFDEKLKAEEARFPRKLEIKKYYEKSEEEKDE